MPSAGYDFVMHPHEHFELALGFLDFEPRGQFEARQALALGFAGECRRPLLVLGSLVSAVEDGGFQVRNSSAYVRLLQKTVPNPPRPRAFAEPSFPSRPSRVAVVAVASGELSRTVIQAQRGVALASRRPRRPNPAPSARTVSGVRLSAASAQPAAAVESPLLREGLQVVKGASVASRCRQRHALAIEPVVLPADSRPSLLRHGEARTRAVRRPIVRQELTSMPAPHSWPPRLGVRVSRRRYLGCFRRGVRAPKSERAQRPSISPSFRGSPGRSGQDLFSLPRQALTIGSVPS